LEAEVVFDQPGNSFPRVACQRGNALLFLLLSPSLSFSWPTHSISEKTNYIHTRDVRGAETGVVARSELRKGPRVRGPMTHQRPLCGGFADVPVDPTKRTLDGDDSGDLYSFLEGALAKEGGVPTPVVILQAARQVVAGLYVRPSLLRSFAPSLLRSFAPSLLRSFAPSPLCTSRRPSHSPSRALLVRPSSFVLRRSPETGSSSSKRTTLRATRP